MSLREFLKHMFVYKSYIPFSNGYLNRKRIKEILRIHKNIDDFMLNYNLSVVSDYFPTGTNESNFKDVIQKRYLCGIRIRKFFSLSSIICFFLC